MDVNHWSRLLSKSKKKEITINIEAPIYLIHLFQNLQSLTTIMNVTSGLSFVPLTKPQFIQAQKLFSILLLFRLGTYLKQKILKLSK